MQFLAAKPDQPNIVTRLAYWCNAADNVQPYRWGERIDLKINVWIRRSVILILSLAVMFVGFDPTSVLVASRVALSFEFPLVLVPCPGSSTAAC